MNRRLLKSLTMFLFAACSTAAADETNLVPNPSFEHADAEGLVADDWASRAGIKVERIADGGRTGRACARFSDDSAERGQMLESRRVPARPGGHYTASAWFRTSDTCRPGVYVNFYDLNGRRIEHRYERTTGSPAGLAARWLFDRPRRHRPGKSLLRSTRMWETLAYSRRTTRQLTVTGGDEPGAPGLTRAKPGDKAGLRHRVTVVSSSWMTF